MSLSISLKVERYTSYDKGETWEEDESWHFSQNLTSNYSTLAIKAGLYDVIWNPNVENVGAIIETLENGLKRLLEQPDYFKQFEPENGWGTYDGFVEFLKDYIKAAKQFPQSTIHVHY